MPQSLHRTWAALALATLAVLVVAFFTGRDFVRDVYPSCPESIAVAPYSPDSAIPELTRVYFDASEPNLTVPTTFHPGRAYRLLFDTKQVSSFASSSTVTEYSNVRVVLSEVGADGKPCACGSIPIHLSGENPWDLSLYRIEGPNELYLVKGRKSVNDLNAPTDERVAFRMSDLPTRHLQTDRIFTTRHLPLAVMWLALGALGIAFVRSRRAMAYALRIHSWTEAHLGAGGMLEGESGGTLGTVEQSRGTRIPSGPVLVAPDALSTAGLYRDVPIVARQNVVEGDHARWARGTTQRLRDARVLAVVSTLCTGLAFAARMWA